MVDDHTVWEFVTVRNRTGSGVMSCRLVPIRGYLANRRQLAMTSVSTRLAASRLSSAINHQMASRSSFAAACTQRAHSSLRVQPRGTPLPQHLNRGIPVDRFTALGLSKARLDMGRYGCALFEHPVFAIELFADDLERLVQDLAGIPIRARPEGQVDHALLFRFQVNRHWGLLFSSYPAARPGVNAMACFSARAQTTGPPHNPGDIVLQPAFASPRVGARQARKRGARYTGWG